MFSETKDAGQETLLLRVECVYFLQKFECYFPVMIIDSNIGWRATIGDI
jgi:hypothetical protein